MIDKKNTKSMIDIKKDLLLERFPAYANEIKNSTHWIRQKDKAVMFIVGQKMGWFNKSETVLLAVKKAKYNTVSLIAKCKEGTNFPITDFSQFEGEQLQLSCIKDIQVHLQNKRIFISFKIENKNHWQIKCFTKESLESWVQEMIKHFGMKFQPEIYGMERQNPNNQHYSLQEVEPFVPESIMLMDELKDLEFAQFLQKFAENVDLFTCAKIVEIVKLRQQRAISKQFSHKKESKELAQKIVARENLWNEITKEYNQLKEKLELNETALVMEQDKYRTLENKSKRENMEKGSLQKKYAQLELSNSQNEQAANELRVRVAEFEASETTLKRKIKQRDEEVIRLKSEIEIKSTEIGQLRSDGQQKDEIIKKQTEQIKQALKNNQYLQKSLEEIKTELQSARQQSQTYKKQAETKISQLSQINKDHQTYKKHATEEISKFSQINEDLSKRLEQIRAQLQRVEASSKFNSQQIDQLLEERLFHIFEKDALHARNPEKLYLCEQIEIAFGHKIKYTKLLCFYDKLNTTNFHQYIDEKPNICCVIRTVSGQCLAGFSQQPFSKQNQAINRGILVSISNKKTYRCKQNKRALTYDDFYAIFGNSEIRVRTGETELFSNIGIATSFYDNNGDRITDFIGENKDRTAKIEHYEFYEVIFE